MNSIQTVYGPVHGKFSNKGNTVISIVPGVVNGAVALAGYGSTFAEIGYANLLDNSCIRRPDLCEFGTTLSIWFRPYEKNSAFSAKFTPIDSGSNLGIGGVWVEIEETYYGSLHIKTDVRSENGKFFKQGEDSDVGILSYFVWNHVVVSISPAGRNGFATYLNGEFYQKSRDARSWAPGTRYSYFAVCRAYSRLDCDEFVVWYHEFHADEIQRMYQNYLN